VRIFDPGAVDRAEQARIERWVERLRHALAGDGFILYYQPVLDLHGEPGELYEAYLRIQNNDELVPPAAFIGIAEQHGLLQEIDQWVVRRAIEVLAERQRAGHDTRLLVKLSPESFATPELAQLIASELARLGVPGERLWLGAPESKVFTHLRDAQRFLADMQRLGCRMGLEQFGSGLDSFQLLSHFQPAFLKLDRNFTNEFAKATEHQDKIREITARAQPAGIQTIAEFVQDAATMSLLFSAGVDYVAGMFVAPASVSMNFEF
jgi:EAL domain-containing protein (putative c-di-GMP-specific phosphodiesterase class I)